MRKRLTMISAALLVAGLAACNRAGSDDDARLNNAASMLDDNGVFDTSPDDAALNQVELPAEETTPANAARANAAAPGNAAGNAQ